MLESVTIRPEPRDWAGLIRRSRDDETLFDRSLGEWRRLTRTELLGVEADRVIATGHQAEFWHPGILAKYIALDAAGRSHDADMLVEFVADHDDNEPLRLRVPTLDRKTDRLSVSVINLAAEPVEAAMDRPTGARDAVSPAASIADRDGLRPAAIGDAPELGVILDALDSNRQSPSLALQVAGATQQLRRQLDLVDPRASLRRMITASSFARTTLWRSLLERLVEDTDAAVSEYNRAALRHPHAGVPPLELIGDEFELPLWRIESTGRRLRASRGDVERALRASDGAASIWPRAALATGFMRLAVADLMIHGLGGELYDHVTEEWFESWAGIRLAPIAVVSATLPLDFGRSMPDQADLDRAVWKSHHLRHNLDRVVGDDQAREQKERLLDAIQAAPRKSAERLGLYHDLHGLRRDLMRRFAPLIEDADREVVRLRRQLAERLITEDRTWAFPLHPPEELIGLRDEVWRRFDETAAQAVDSSTTHDGRSVASRAD